MLASILIVSLHLISFQSPNLTQRPKEPPVVDIKFEGNKIFATDELLKFVREGCEKEPEGSSNHLEEAEWCGRRLARHIQSAGYLEAKVVTKLTDPGRVVSYSIDEGTLYWLGTIKIEGNKALTEQQIRSKLQLGPGAVANGDKISKWLFDDLKKAYDELGYIRFTVEVEPTFKREEGIVDLAVSIDEDQKHVLKSITFLGEPIAGMNFDALFLIHAGDTFNDRLYRESIARLNATGLYAPINPDSDSAFKLDKESVAVSITVRLKKP